MIDARLTSVRVLYTNQQLIEQVSEHLRSIGDLERSITKICAGKAGPRDMIALKNGLLQIPFIRTIIFELKTPLFQSIVNRLHDLSAITDMISRALREDAPAQLGAGIAFNTGFSNELDTYLEALHSGKDWIKAYQERERESTGISSLKISSNNVFGYYIEISNTHKSRVPEDRYQRRQTLANAERYITQELKEIEQKITSADEKISTLEQSLFQELRNAIIVHTESIQSIALAIAELDCLQSFASVSLKHQYVEPVIGEDTSLSIISGRHPVVERMLSPGNPFTPNDTICNDSEQFQYLENDEIFSKQNLILFPKVRGKRIRRFRQFFYFSIKNRGKKLFDILHFSVPRVYPFYWIFPAKLFVCTFHSAGDITAPKDKMVLSREIYNLTAKLFQRYFSKIIADSEEGKLEIVEKYHIPASNIVTILPGTDSLWVYGKNPSSEFIEYLKKLTGKKLIVVMGRWQKFKNVQSAILAYSQIQIHLRSDLHLILVGKTDLSGKNLVLEQLKKLIPKSPLTQRRL